MYTKNHNCYHKWEESSVEKGLVWMMGPGPRKFRKEIAWGMGGSTSPGTIRTRLVSFKGNLLMCKTKET